MPTRRFAAIANELLTTGWRIEAEGKIYRPASSMRLAVSSGIDWFDLHGTVQFGDDQAALVDVLAALSRGEQTIVLGDGTVGLLPEQWLRRYLPLAAAGQHTGDALRFRQAQAALLDALLEQQDADARHDCGGRRLSARATSWRGSTRLPASIRPRHLPERSAPTSATAWPGCNFSRAPASAAAWPTTWGSERP